jgi:energy-coupling factor transporter transmembrane protein EcfT
LPWSRRKWNKYSMQVSILLGLVASVPINLATSWFQQFFSNGFVLVCIIVIILAIFYFIRKLSIPLLTTAFWTMVAGVCLNILAQWLQTHVLHDTFPPSTVLLILFSAIGALTLSALIDPKVLTKFEYKMKARYKRRAKQESINLASRGKTTKVQKRPPRMKR